MKTNEEAIVSMFSEKISIRSLLNLVHIFRNIRQYPDYLLGTSYSLAASGLPFDLHLLAKIALFTLTLQISGKPCQIARPLLLDKM